MNYIKNIKYIIIFLLIITGLSISIPVKLLYENRKCISQESNLGIKFNTIDDVVNYVLNKDNPTGLFMWSPIYHKYWGTYQCKVGKGFGQSHNLWNVYSYIVPTSVPTQNPTKLPTSFNIQFCNSDLNKQFCGYSGINTDNCESLNCCNDDYMSQTIKRRRRRRLVLEMGIKECYPKKHLININNNLDKNNSLKNDKLSYNFINIHESNIWRRQRTWPSYPGQANLIKNPNNMKAYLISSNFRYPWNNINYRCSYPLKKIEIMELNLNTDKIEQRMLIGNTVFSDSYLTKPQAQGGDVSDETLVNGGSIINNILYIITGNKYECASNYNFESTLIRFNVNTFNFIDKTFFKDMSGPIINGDNEYLFKPSTTLYIGTDLFISFEDINTGIFKIDLTINLNLLNYIRPSYIVEEEKIVNDEPILVNITKYLKSIKHSAYDNDRNNLYFIEDEGVISSHLRMVKFNINNFNNNVVVKKIEGISGVSRIKYYKNTFYALVGHKNPVELFRFDINGNLIEISNSCGKKSIVFPMDYLINNFEIDTNTEFIYLTSYESPNVKLFRINLKTFSYDNNDILPLTANYYRAVSSNFHANSNIHFKAETQIENTYYIPKINVSLFVPELGKLYLTTSIKGPAPSVLIKVNLTGCEKGTYINNNKCIDCIAGKFSNNIGSLKCIDCIAGKFSSINGSTSCSICNKGTISNNSASTCSSCTLGRYSEHEDMSSCKLCLAGKFSTTIGAIDEETCMNCYTGLISPPGSSICTKCNSGEYKSGDNSCSKCPVGRFGSNIGLENINRCTKCPEGKYGLNIGYSNDSVCNKCPIGKYNNLKGQTDIINCINCKSGKYSKTNGNPSESNCISCINNALSNIDNTKCICDNGYYEIKENRNLVCETCPEKATCVKNTTIKTLNIKSGYWRHSLTTIDIRECFIENSCIGGISTNNINDICYKGHKGPYCDICINNYAKGTNDLCSECPKDQEEINILITFLIISIILGIVSFLIITANPSGNQIDLVSGIAKVLTNYLQVFSLAKEFDVKWPSLLKIFYSTSNKASNPSIQFYSSDCSINFNYYQIFILYNLLPICFIIIVMIILFIISYYKEICYNKDLKEIEDNYNKEQLDSNNNISLSESYENYTLNKNKIINSFINKCTFIKKWINTSLVVGLFLIYPLLITNVFSMLSCIRVGDKYVISNNMDIECYTVKHETYSIFAYIFMLIYGLGIPLLAFLLIFKYRNRLYSSELNTERNEASSLSFLFLGYKENKYFWEIIILFRKLGIIMISVFLKESSRYQMNCACWLIQISLILHLYYEPYNTLNNYGKICNRLEILSLIALTFTLNIGIIFGTKRDNYDLGDYENILVILVFIINLFTFSIFLYYLLIYGIRQVRNFVKEVISCILIIQEENGNFYIRPCIKKILNCTGYNLNNTIEWSRNQEDINIDINDNDIDFNNYDDRNGTTEKLDIELQLFRETVNIDNCIYTNNINDKLEYLHKILEIKQKYQKNELFKYKKYINKLKHFVKQYTNNELNSPTAKEKFNSYKEKDNEENIDKNIIFNIFELFYCDMKEHYFTMDELHKNIINIDNDDDEIIINNTINYIINDKMNEIKDNVVNLINMENEDINVNIEKKIDSIINEIQSPKIKK